LKGIKIGMNEKSLIGEFYVVAQLFQRGFVAAPTLGKTKHVDILVYNPKTDKRLLVEVKTTSEKVWNTKLFGRNYEWMMDEKHENITNENLFYCFVLLRGTERLPRFFIVPSRDVADYVKQEHQLSVASRKKKVAGMTEVKVRKKVYPIADYLDKLEKGKMRAFRIPTDGVAKYENRWSLLQ